MGDLLFNLTGLEVKEQTEFSMPEILCTDPMKRV
jgi:hypothetical protein